MGKVRILAFVVSSLRKLWETAAEKKNQALFANLQMLSRLKWNFRVGG